MEKTETRDQMVVFTLEPAGWWATWIPGSENNTVGIHGGTGPIPTRVGELVSFDLWDVFDVPAGDDVDEVEEVLEAGGFRVVSRECLALS